MCEVKLSQNQQGLYGIVGHVGVGHVHSHSGFVQDDSAGFAVASTLLKKAVDVDTTIKSASICLKTGAVKIITNFGENFLDDHCSNEAMESIQKIISFSDVIKDFF